MRCQQYRDGRRNGIKACVEWLHNEAKRMNNPEAEAILNTAAFNLGTDLKSTKNPSR